MTRLWWMAILVAAGALAWRLLARRPRPRPEQALILTLRLADAETPVEELHARVLAVDRALRDAVEGRGVGQVEEPFARGGECIYTCYGPDADRLWDAASLALQSSRLLAGSRGVRRYGPPGAPEESVALARDG